MRAASYLGNAEQSALEQQLEQENEEYQQRRDDRAESSDEDM